MRNGRRSAWFSLRLKRKVTRSEFDKLHLATNVRPRHGRGVLLVYDWIRTSGRAGDSPRFKELVRKAAEFGHLRNVLADSAYLSRDNAQFVADLGGRPYIRPKSNSTRKGKGRKAYKKMIDLFKDHRRKFAHVYGRRWGGETCNYVLKSKFESELRCRSSACQHAEAGMMIIGHNSRELLKLDIMEEIVAEN